MSGILYGYARVSTRGQKEDRQLTALTEFGVTAEHIVVEKQSGKNFDRPLYQQLVRAFRPGDVLAIKSIDRLGRNYEEILEQWAYITKTCRAAIVVLDMPLLDTREGRDLTGMLVADIVLQLLSYVAQTEREFLRQRQAEGIAAAKARGVKFGRPVKPLPQNFHQLHGAWRGKKITLQEAAAACSMPVSSFYAKALALEKSEIFKPPGHPSY